MKYDFNVLERAARELIMRSQYRDALRIYYFMSDGDPSLDAGYLGERIGECYEALGELQAAKYWYGRAVEENPEARAKSVAALSRLAGVSIDDLLPPKA
jgi:tetratricopeptide (TPR) repeat protein